MKIGYYKRRDFLRQGGSLAAFFPFLRVLGSTAVAATPVVPRVVYWYTPLGAIPSKVWPTGSDNAPVLTTMMSALNPHKSDLTILKGMGLKNGPAAGSHNQGFIQILTGAAPGGGVSHSARATAQSLDDVLMKERKLKRLYVAVQPRMQRDRYDNISYSGKEQPNPFDSLPQNTYAKLFKTLKVPTGTNPTPAPMDTKPEAYKHMMSVLRDDAAKIQNLFSGDADVRAQFDKYTEAINSLETTAGGVQVPTGAGCAVPPEGTQSNATSVDLFPATGKAFMHQMQMALACNLAQIGIFQWSGAGVQDGHSTPWIKYNNAPITDNHHYISHIRGSDPVPKQELIYKWYYEQLAYFVSLLKMIPGDDGGTLLDSTLIATVSDCQDGDSHTFNNIPMLVLGGKKLGIKHKAEGRVLQLGYGSWSQNAPHNRLLISTANVLGSPITKLGPSGDRPLTELFT